MAWDAQAYYQDPYQGYNQDPYQAWGQDPHGYGYGYEPEQVEETESQKLKREQEELEKLESNRLYLRKVKKQCVKEDFSELNKPQLFLIEVLIESLAVNTESDLRLIKVDDDTPTSILARVQFLNSPFLEISEKDMSDGQGSAENETKYLQTIGESGLSDAYQTTTKKETPTKEGEEGKKELEYDVRWNNANGKSCLFSMTPLQMIRNLERFPVTVQVMRIAEIKKEEPRESHSEVSNKQSEDEHKQIETEPLGYARIRLPDHFSLSILQSCKPQVILPVSCVHSTSTELKNVFGVKKGELKLFVRLSSFGPVIITSFQTVGRDRQYVFKPSPLSSMIEEHEDQLPHDLEVPKPVYAEEETTYGITVLKEHDIFQKPVLWKMNEGPLSCGCMNEGGCFNEGPQKVPITQSSLFQPRPSMMSLCRDVQPPSDPQTIRQFGRKQCDWHNLVSLEIKNSPGHNCGCLEEKDVLHSKTKKPELFKTYPLPKDASALPKGLGIKPEPSGCECNCPLIKKSLLEKKLY